MSQDPKSPSLPRRAVFAGAGAVGALAGAAALLPGTRMPVVATAQAPTSPEGQGYQVTAHVMRYYQTARV